MLFSSCVAESVTDTGDSVCTAHSNKSLVFAPVSQLILPSLCRCVALSCYHVFLRWLLLLLPAPLLPGNGRRGVDDNPWFHLGEGVLHKLRAALKDWDVGFGVAAGQTSTGSSSRWRQRSVISSI